MCTYVPKEARAMRIVDARDLGLYVRQRRHDLGLTQSDLADAAGVSRRWLLGLESGKETTQVGLVFRTLDALGLVLDARADAPPDPVDLDGLLHDLDQRTDG
jgi:HTH-type transcriptional regulator / antitoxin HipB